MMTAETPVEAPGGYLQWIMRKLREKTVEHATGLLVSVLFGLVLTYVFHPDTPVGQAVRKQIEKLDPMSSSESSVTASRASDARSDVTERQKAPVDLAGPTDADELAEAVGFLSRASGTELMPLVYRSAQGRKLDAQDLDNLRFGKPRVRMVEARYTEEEIRQRRSAGLMPGARVGDLFWKPVSDDRSVWADLELPKVLLRYDYAATIASMDQPEAATVWHQLVLPVVTNRKTTTLEMQSDEWRREWKVTWRGLRLLLKYFPRAFDEQRDASVTQLALLELTLKTLNR